MRYLQFRALIHEELAQTPEGRTWAELRDRLNLPYDRPCQTWVARLEQEIGLRRTRTSGSELVWKLFGE